MQIYLIRHGGVDNPEHVAYGRLPGFHLSETGKQEIINLAQRFSENKIAIEKIFSSPLTRTVESAQVFAQALNFPLGIITNDRLIEVDCRSWEGKPMNDFDNERSRNPNIDIERRSDAGARVLSVLSGLEGQYNSVAVFSHGDPIIGAVDLIRKTQTPLPQFLSTAHFYKITLQNSQFSVGQENEF